MRTICFYTQWMRSLPLSSSLLMSRKFIAAFGEYLWDCHKDYRVPGGAPANALYHSTQFNSEGILITAIGQDADGDALLEELEGKGLNLTAVQRNEVLPTGTVDIDESDLNEPKYDIKTDVAWGAIHEFDGMEELAARCDAVLYGSLSQIGEVSRNTLYRFLALTSPSCMKVCDINLRYKYGGEELICNDAILLASIEKCNILKVNAGELGVLSSKFGCEFNKGDIKGSARHFLARFPNVETLIVTLGTDGSWVVSRNGEETFCNIPKIEFRNAVGAGDAFMGAYLGCILDGRPQSIAHRTAVNVSAYVCTQEGAMPIVPDSVR